MELAVLEACELLLRAGGVEFELPPPPQAVRLNRQEIKKTILDKNIGWPMV